MDWADIALGVRRGSRAALSVVTVVCVLRQGYDGVVGDEVCLEREDSVH